MALDVNADLGTGIAYSFQAPAVSGQQVQATQTFGAAALDPKLQQQLNQVLRPEDNGHRAIQVEATPLDCIDRISSDVQAQQGLHVVIQC